MGRRRIPKQAKKRTKNAGVGAAPTAAKLSLLSPDSFVDDPVHNDVATGDSDSPHASAPPNPSAVSGPNAAAAPTLSAVPAIPGVVDPDLLAPVLLAQPEGSPARKLLSLMYERYAGGKPLAYFCEEAGMDFEELVGMVEKHYSGVARISASKHYVQVFEDTAIDAKSRYGACDRCYGSGWAHTVIDGAVVQLGKPCPYCEGLGQRRYAADRHARAIMFEAMGIVGKSRTPLVAIQQNISVGSEQANRVGFAQKLLAAGRK